MKIKIEADKVNGQSIVNMLTAYKNTHITADFSFEVEATKKKGGKK
jgi:hypothetical protein|tara:strand:- start:19 stop:156 length:138 start_codon:yes stop_codon:yes gene_type:complete